MAIIGTYFEGDTLQFLKELQHDCYSGPDSTLAQLFLEAQALYAAHPTSSDELTAMLATKKTVDHRTLQYTHDHLAAWYRFTFTGQLELELGVRQLRTVDGIEANRKAYCSTQEWEWRHWWLKEIQKLLNGNPLFLHLVATAGAFPNPDPRGTYAEGQLSHFLKRAYPLPPPVRD